MLSPKMQEALNTQINHEFYSSYLYLAMAAHFESQNLPGCARWMRRQSQEEYAHAMRIFDFILDRDGQVSLKPIAQPDGGFGKPSEVFEQALDHEKKITGSINDLYGRAQAEKDYPTEIMLQWFVNEQVEEEKTAAAIVEQFKLAGEHGSALLMLDNRLGQRE